MAEQTKLTSLDHMKAALEILKSRNIEPVGHFSPYDENGEYESGSGLQRFWDADNRYEFFFDREGNLVWSNLKNE